MIWGVVNLRHEAVVTLHVRGPTGTEVGIDAVVDTGSSASLTLPPATVAALGLVRQSGGSAILADGSSAMFDIFGAEVEWDGTWQAILVSAVGNAPLLGTGLLAGYELRVEVAPGGVVEINPLP
jgi:clan AA aspartic protease